MGRGEGTQTLGAPAAAARGAGLIRSAARGAASALPSADSLRRGLTEQSARQIFGKKDRKIDFLRRLDEVEGKQPTKRPASTPLERINAELIERWDYETARPIVREMFRESEKYAQMAAAEDKYREELQGWEQIYPGEPVDWAFAPAQFDKFRAQVARDETLTRVEQLDKISDAAKRNLLVGEINTARNDMIEHLFFEASEEVLPTLDHLKGVDFYVAGEPFDQKVSKSPTQEFKKAKGEGWKQAAKDDPAEVARYLYTHQDPDRFSADPRFLIVCLDEGLSADEIKELFHRELDITKPHKIDFIYNHKSGGGAKRYSTSAHVLLLAK